MRYECKDCGSIFYEEEVKSWLDIAVSKKIYLMPCCPFCGSRWIE